MDLPDNKTVDLQLFILDPLSVIIKLAILSNKPIGTKICISKNMKNIVQCLISVNCSIQFIK